VVLKKAQKGSIALRQAAKEVKIAERHRVRRLPVRPKESGGIRHKTGMAGKVGLAIRYAISRTCDWESSWRFCLSRHWGKH
jgi:hypothetical protein